MQWETVMLRLGQIKKAPPSARQNRLPAEQIESQRRLLSRSVTQFKG